MLAINYVHSLNRLIKCTYTLLCFVLFVACGSGQPSNSQEDPPKTTNTAQETDSTSEPQKQVESKVAEANKNAPSTIEKTIPAYTDYKLLGPKDVSRWEPSGVAATDQGIWVVSDREAWITFYEFPLKKGTNEPKLVHQLKPELDNRIKWEGLEWAKTKDGDQLLVLEAISRSVWQCKEPKKGCPNLKKIELQPLNDMLNKVVARSFKYIMFEALAFIDQPIIGVRGYQDKKKGLVPWPLLASKDGSLILDARSSVNIDGKKYGISGSTYDDNRKGFWFTWTYEDEKGSTKESVAGLLTFAPVQTVKTEAKERKNLEYGSMRIDLNANPLKVCKQFQLKPEGVSLNSKGQIFVVFDEDLDRKKGEESEEDVPNLNQRFPLLDNQDYLFMGNAEDVHGKCKALKK